eukprot:TRINITY_DN6528_c0_g4_i1.p1 TRINITY_DN6528_c0_g4~~TRINITY_DN6528_c0_g4_i1.p1  ORF type:complete len:432 (+),score=107.92 TRINITY_DN6528_c0_g4_i1:152-1297(+)
MPEHAARGFASGHQELQPAYCALRAPLPGPLRQEYAELRRLQQGGGERDSGAACFMELPLQAALVRGPLSGAALQELAGAAGAADWGAFSEEAVRRELAALCGAELAEACDWELQCVLAWQLFLLCKAAEGLSTTQQPPPGWGAPPAAATTPAAPAPAMPNGGSQVHAAADADEADGSSDGGSGGAAEVPLGLRLVGPSRPCPMWLAAQRRAVRKALHRECAKADGEPLASTRPEPRQAELAEAERRQRQLRPYAVLELDDPSGKHCLCRWEMMHRVATVGRGPGCGGLARLDAAPYAPYPECMAQEEVLVFADRRGGLRVLPGSGLPLRIVSLSEQDGSPRERLVPPDGVSRALQPDGATLLLGSSGCVLRIRPILGPIG